MNNNKHFQYVRCQRPGLILTVISSLFFIFAGLSCPRRPDMATQKRQETIESMYQEHKKSFPEVPDLSVPELLNMQKYRSVLLVDVRQPKEREVSMIADSVSAEQFEKEKDKYQDRVIVTYCTIGKRGGLYAQKLLQDNWDVYNLRGSILAWINYGQEVVNAEGTTKKVHVYASRWNLLPEDYEGIW